MMQILNNHINVEIGELLTAVQDVVFGVILDDAIVNHFIFPSLEVDNYSITQTKIRHARKQNKAKY